MLRAARLMARLNFTLEERTAELLENALDLLSRVSGERILNELGLIFRELYPERVLPQLGRLKILKAIHPGLMVDEWLTGRLEKLRSGLDHTPWAGLTPNSTHYLGLMSFWLAGDELDALMQRPNLGANQRRILKQAYTIRRKSAEIANTKQNSTLYHLLTPTSDDARLIAWLALDNEAAGRQIVRFQTTLRDVSPIIDGHYLKEEFQLPPGPIYRQILNTLRDACLDGFATTLADERAIVKQILAGQKKDNKNSA